MLDPELMDTEGDGPDPITAEGWQRYRLDLEYDGTEFSGWQWQPGYRTVQGVLEAAIANIYKIQTIRVNGAGRTDAGVHARRQTAHFDAPLRLPPGKLKLALNGNSPPDVRIIELSLATSDFHARYSAKWRWYRYRLFLTPRAVSRQFGWHPLFELRSDLLQSAAKLLIGDHDFRAFSCLPQGEPRQPYGAQCRVFAAGWELLPAEFRFHIVANRFLRHTVRGLVGAMVELARGRFDLAEFSSFLQAAQKSNLIYNAPPQGLCLMRVGYGEYPLVEVDNLDRIQVPILTPE